MRPVKCYRAAFADRSAGAPESAPRYRVTFLWEDGARKPYHWTEDGTAVGNGIFTREAADRVAKACNDEMAAAQVEQLIDGEWRIV